MAKYADELNTLILISLLKQHNIRQVVISPGTSNISFVISVQNDSWFKVISAVDERSASFIACGLADASNEPVVLSCTGATASRNYLPGLTEAYYRNLPILAVTSSQSIFRVESYIPQFLDRTQQFNDLVKLSFQAPAITEKDVTFYSTQINRVILEMTHNEIGPVHINLESSYSGRFINALPTTRKITRYCLSDDLPIFPQNYKVGVFIGSHLPFSDVEQDVIDRFCEINNAIVICDQTSNFRGKYRYLANLANQQEKILSSRKFDLLIHLGSISGAYIPLTAKEVWRVNSDGEVRDLFGSLTKVFQMNEIDFFSYYSRTENANNTSSLLDSVVNERNGLLKKMGELPFSNLWIAHQIENRLPKNSVLHLAILNSLRAWNIFETDPSITCYSNTGGFGIDGCLSSFIGAAQAAPYRQFYGVFGDLSFFYDVNSVLNRIPNNVHILLINNGVGTEFKNYSHLASRFGSDADIFIAAKGHNGYKSSSLIKNLATNVGLKYLTANDKTSFESVKDRWLNEGGVILEVFTNDMDESKALLQVNTIEREKKAAIKKKLKNTSVYKIFKLALRRY